MRKELVPNSFPEESVFIGYHFFSRRFEELPAILPALELVPPDALSLQSRQWAIPTFLRRRGALTEASFDRLIA